jgi:plasmid stability protein
MHDIRLYNFIMASLTIRKLDDPLKARLRIRAATHGHSMEEEARTILRAALNQETPAPGNPPGNLYDAIRACFVESGGGELEAMPREPIRDPPTFA